MPARPRRQCRGRATTGRCPYTPSQKSPSVPLCQRGKPEPRRRENPPLRKGGSAKRRGICGAREGQVSPSSEGWPKAGVGFGIGQMGQPTPLLRRTPPRRGNKAPKTSRPHHRLLTDAAGLLTTPESLPETTNQGVSCGKITLRHATNIDSKRTKLLESPPCTTSR